MKIHAIRTGSVSIKSAQVKGRGRGLARQLAIFRDRVWTDWLPTFAWAIEHPEGVIVVDTGQGVHLLEAGRSLHPYIRTQVQFQIEEEQEVGPQLRKLGIGPADVRKVVLTHLHIDHDGGLTHFPKSEIHVARGEIAAARGLGGRLRGYLPGNWPSFFAAVPLDLTDGPFGPFAASARLTRSGDVVAIATPGHTKHHISVIVQDGARNVLLAGDASYTEKLMLDGAIDGVSGNDAVSRLTLEKIRQFVAKRPTIYLPTHDPDAARRLDSGVFADEGSLTPKGR